MVKSERRREIMKYLEANVTVETYTLARLFDVSQMTIRRDFEELEKRGLITSIHGGAIINTLPTLVSKRQQLIETGEEKRIIAKKAASLINDGDTIILDAGSSIKELAIAVTSKKELTVLTNSILVMNVLAQTGSDIKMIVLPGHFRKSSMAFFGAMTNNFLSHFRVDKAFIGVMGISANDGVTIIDMEEGCTKAKMIEVSNQSIVLAD